ncbi:hypothetical protein CHLRE_02g144550v5 [Chlamydomonas reinhardtii]|uniref:Sodium/hydrogen exchanger n=1 Tax=Chlamydomonas reinhardtii TaxID=3055 RepID=A0A2K3E404_CHLRE|nr:uncharacterized protein CHLRE_02g144550v5 [Chlamydomonas reinhardtii]PNW87467.1 hypothetical protein CHLRE_02g144550v5 [Chlamydomonas reinhardtii]
MGEAGAALLLGLVVGLIMKAAHVGHTLAESVEFRGEIFFYVLLPTIMFDAGYGLDAKVFLRNVGSVCSFAFLGTTISTFVVGLIMWGFGRQGWCYQMTLLENLTFGALISATDPVTVLAVFQRLGAQPDLYMNVFGESVLNDAVGLVLFQVITKFLEGKAVTGPNVMAGIGLFIGIFAASVAIGLAVGFLASLIFRSRFFYSGAIHDPVTGKLVTPAGNSVFEVGVAVTFAYASYLVADVAHCSGIVAVVTNGMVMNLYVRPNLSHEAEIKIEYLFKVLAALFELFVFCYIGSTLFLGPQHYNVWSYTALCLIALAASRAANIYPLSLLCNLLRPIERRITQKEQFMMWWSGLRGAMAFALAVEASESYGEAGQVMKTVTFYLIFITVLWNGGSASYLLEVLRLRATDPLPNKYARAQAAKHEADVAASRAVADLQRASAALERGTQELGVRVKQEQQVKAHAKAGASFEHKSDESSGSGSGSGSTDGVANPGSGAAAPSAATSAAAVVAGGAAAGVSAAAALPEAGAPQVDVADRRIKRGSTPAAAAAAAAAATAAAVPVPEVEMELAGIQADLEKGRFARVSRSLVDMRQGPDDPFAATAAIAIASPPPASTTAHGYAIPGRHVGGANGANGGRPLSASGAAGTGSMKRTGSLLQRLQSINDGHRILGGFDRVHSKLTKLLVHPRALHEHEAASPSALGHALAHAASAAPALSHAPSAPPPLSPAAGSAAAAAGGSPPPASGTGASGSSGSTSGGAALARQVSAPPVQLDGGPRSSGSPLGAAPAPAAAQPASLAPVHERASVPEDQ